MSERNTIGASNDLVHAEAATALSAWRFEKCLYDLMASLKAGYRPDQTRVPAGQPNGGQWTAGNGNGSYRGQPDPPIEPVYPIEDAMMLLTGAQAVSAIARAALASRQAVVAATSAAEAEIETAIIAAANAIERFIGGKVKPIRNKADDLIIMKGDEKIRFDINKSSGDKPHFYVEKYDEEIDDWVDVGDHRYYFKDEP